MHPHAHHEFEFAVESLGQLTRTSKRITTVISNGERDTTLVKHSIEDVKVTKDTFYYSLTHRTHALNLFPSFMCLCVCVHQSCISLSLSRPFAYSLTLLSLPIHLFNQWHSLRLHISLGSFICWCTWTPCRPVIHLYSSHTHSRLERPVNGETRDERERGKQTSSNMHT